MLMVGDSIVTTGGDIVDVLLAVFRGVNTNLELVLVCRSNQLIHTVFLSTVMTRAMHYGKGIRQYLQIAYPL